MSNATTLLVLSLFHILLGMYAYLKFGGRRVSATGAFALASAVFLGLPAFGIALKSSNVIDAVNVEVLVIAGLVLTAVCIVSAIFSLPLRMPADALQSLDQRRISVSSRRFAFMIGLAVVGSALFTGLSLLGVPIGPTVERVASVAMISSAAWFAIGSLPSGRTAKLPLSILILSAVLYGAATFDGGGRLVLAVTAFSVFCVYLFFNPMRFGKLISIVLLAPALLIFGFIRSKSKSFLAVIADGDGLESVFAPYVTLVDLVQHIREQNLPFTGLDSFVAALLFWVPGGLWADKPNGLGYELTLMLQPQYAYTGHSMAASYLGEFFLAGGYLGIIIGVLFMMVGLVSLDAALRWLASRRTLKFRHAATAIALYFLVSGLFDYVWVGSFTFFSRDVFRLAIWIVLWLFVEFIYVFQGRIRF